MILTCGSVDLLNMSKFTPKTTEGQTDIQINYEKIMRF
jgi:hypothetical protein